MNFVSSQSSDSSEVENILLWILHTLLIDHIVHCNFWMKFVIYIKDTSIICHLANFFA